MSYGTYDPGVRFDPSPIYAGLASAGQDIKQALNEYADKKAKKELFDKAVSGFVEDMSKHPEMAQSVGVDINDPRAAKVAVEAAGGPEAFLRMRADAKSLHAYEDQQKLRDLQMENERLHNTALTLAAQKDAADSAASQKLFEAGPATATLDQQYIRPGATGERMAPGAGPGAGPEPGHLTERAIQLGVTEPAKLQALQHIDAVNLATIAKNGRRSHIETPTDEQGAAAIGPDGKPMKYFIDMNGNSHPINSAGKPGSESQLGKLIAERASYAAAGNQAAVAEYDRVIKSIGLKTDAFGNPITGEPLPPADPFAAEGLPEPKNRQERDQLPPGSKYKGPDGQVYTTPGMAAAAPVATAAQPVQLSTKDQQALVWARANPADPRAAAILKRLAGGR